LFSSIGLLIGAYNFAQLHHPVLFGDKQMLASHLPLAIAGGVIMVLSLYLWSLEGPGGYHLHIDEKGNIKESRGGH
jgi:cytochrome c oxidase subunit 1